MTLAAAWALVKLVLWTWVIFWFFARRIFSSKNNASGGLGSVIKMAFSCVVLVHGLALLGMLDPMSLTLSFFALGFGRIWHRDRVSLAVKAKIWFERGHIFVFNALDGVGGTANLNTLGKSVAQVGRRSLKNGYQVAPKILAFGSLAMFLVLLRFPAVAQYPFPESDVEFSHLRTFKQLGANDVLSSVSYPQGSHALGVVLRSASLLDESLLWKLCGVMLPMSIFMLVFVVVRRLTESNAFGVPLIAGVCASFFSGTDLLDSRDVSGEVLPIQFAAPLLIAAAVSYARESRLETPSGATAMAASALLFLVHPLAGLLFLSGVFLAWLASTAFGTPLRNSASLLMWNGAGVLFAGVWFSIAFALSGEGTWGWIKSEVWSETAYSSTLDHVPLVVAGSAAALFSVLIPPSGVAREPRTTLGALYLGCVSLAVLPRFGLPQVFPPDGVLILLAPLGAVALGVAMHRVVSGVFSATLGESSPVYRWQTAPPMIVIAALLMVFPPPIAEAVSHPEPIAVLRAYHRMRDAMVEGSWTAVAHAELAYHTQGYGWFVSRQEFLRRYPVESYRWDPRTPDTAIPSQHTFFFVEKIEPVDLRQDALGPGRALENERLGEWILTYSKQNDDLTVFYEDTHVVVYHLMRSRESERALLNQIWAQENLQSRPPEPEE